MSSLLPSSVVQRMAASESWTVINAMCSIGDYEALTSEQLLDAWLSLSKSTDRAQAKGMILNAAAKIRQKTQVAGVLDAAMREFIQGKKEENANTTSFSTP